MIEFKIYILLDPRDKKFNPRYVGITSNKYLSNRLSSHVNDSAKYKHHNSRWIQSLLKNGVKPKIILVDIVESWSEACEIEIGLIRVLGKKYKLNNNTLGGDGCIGHRHTEETKCKIREKRKFQIITNETKSKISNSLTGHYVSNDTKIKIGSSKIGNKFWLGRKHSSKTIEKLRKIKLNQSPETRKKISESNKNQPVYICPYCNKSGIGSAMYRWHFNNCKFKTY